MAFVYADGITFLTPCKMQISTSNNSESRESFASEVDIYYLMIVTANYYILKNCLQMLCSQVLQLMGRWFICQRMLLD